MGTTIQKLNKLLETKTNIKNAIINKGVSVSDSDTFASYPDKISQISGGGGTGSGELDDYIKGTIETINIPDGVTTIRESLFNNTPSIKKLNLVSGIKTIDKSAFANCTGLSSILFNSDITAIKDEAFSDCSSLNIETLPDSINTLGIRCFDNCTSLTLSVLPRNLGTVSNYCFYNCSNMNVNKIKNSVGVIGNNSFTNHTNMTKIFIAKSVSYIDASYSSTIPFKNCVNLTDIYTDATEKPANWGRYFNYTSSSTQATVHYGVSEEEFDSIVGGV